MLCVLGFRSCKEQENISRELWNVVHWNTRAIPFGDEHFEYVLSANVQCLPGVHDTNSEIMPHQIAPNTASTGSSPGSLQGSMQQCL